jgi:hypothetical protein
LRKFSTIGFLLALITQGGCAQPWNNLHYEGKLISGHFPSGQTVGSRELFQIYMDINANHDRLVQFKNRDGKSLFEFSISEIKSKSFQLNLPFLNQSFKLKKSQNPLNALNTSQCYAHSTSFVITTCFGANNFYFDIKDATGVSLIETVGGEFERAKFEYEPQQSLTLTGAIQRALKKNFKSLVEYEHMIQASDNALAANYNLYPHFRYYQGAALAFLSPVPLLVSIGDWFPFLFPNRWMFAKVEDAEAKAVEVSFVIMRANLAAEVQTSSYAMIHDVKRLEILNQMRQEVFSGVSAARDLYERRIIQVHPVSAFDAFAKTLDIPINSAKAAVNNDRAALSEVLGYLNPRAVKAIVDDAAFPKIEFGQLLEPSSIIQVAFSASLERRQIFYLKKAVRAKKMENAFHWLDPSALSHNALGINLLPRRKSFEAEFRALTQEESRLEQNVNQKVEALVRQHNGVLLGYKGALEAHDAHRNRLVALWDSVNSAKLPESRKEEGQGQLELYLFEIIQAYKDILQISLASEDYLETWDRSEAGFQRLMLTEFYQHIRDQKVDPLSDDKSESSQGSLTGDLTGDLNDEDTLR